MHTRVHIGNRTKCGHLLINWIVTMHDAVWTCRVQMHLM